MRNLAQIQCGVYLQRQISERAKAMVMSRGKRFVKSILLELRGMQQ